VPIVDFSINILGYPLSIPTIKKLQIISIADTRIQSKEAIAVQ
jgi:hypothetical protein